MTEEWGLAIAIFSLAAVIGGAMISFGRFQGKIGEKTVRLEKDIDLLWIHQRGQDERCLSTTSIHSTELIQVVEGLKGLKDLVNELRADVKNLMKRREDHGPE